VGATRAVAATEKVAMVMDMMILIMVTPSDMVEEIYVDCVSLNFSMTLVY
jgi:hypothetical protein